MEPVTDPVTENVTTCNGHGRLFEGRDATCHGHGMRACKLDARQAVTDKDLKRTWVLYGGTLSVLTERL